jgi:hypothetical protein
MNKKLFLFLFLLANYTNILAQKLTTPSNYVVTYKIKIAEILDAKSAKDAAADLTDLFDSNLQTFNPATNELVIKSVFVQGKETFAENLLEIGYTLITFSVFYKEISITTPK